MPPEDPLDEPPEEPREDDPPEEPRDEPPDGLLTGVDRELLLRVELFEPDEERPLSLLRCVLAGWGRSLDLERVEDPESRELRAGAEERSRALVVPLSRVGRDRLLAFVASRSRALRSKRRSIPLPVRLLARSNDRVLRSVAGVLPRVLLALYARVPIPSLT